jgi:hypothetical protein
MSSRNAIVLGYGTETTSRSHQLPRPGPAHLSTDESPHACLEGVVYIGVLVEQDGEEVEEYAPYLC